MNKRCFLRIWHENIASRACTQLIYGYCSLFELLLNLAMIMRFAELQKSLKQVGIRGGLKKIEKQMGIARSDETEGLSGLDAIYLWRRFLRGEDNALKTLIAYNKEDVVNLEVLAQIAYDRLKATELRSADISVRDFGLFAAKD